MCFPSHSGFHHLTVIDWNEGSFNSYIRTTHHVAVLSGDIISLLWRSFAYYAYHPFPRGLPDLQIDEHAFQRAMLLLVLQTNELLGTQEGDWFWREDDVYFAKKSWQRMLRSISIPETKCMDSEKRVENDRKEDMINDVMDVLSMTQPQAGLPQIPDPSQLEPAARRFIDRVEIDTYQFCTTRDNVQALVEVLLQLELRKNRWGGGFHTGSLNTASQQGSEMAKTLASSIQGTDRFDVLVSDDMDMLMHRLVSPITRVPKLALRYAD